jgi:outer membrane protein OmpA-like peptidoglycan-associated protein
MPNTENTSNQTATTQNTTYSSEPTVALNAPHDNESANIKQNPNMVMALVLCVMLITGLAFAFLFDGSKVVGVNSQLTEKENLQRLIDSERSGIPMNSQESTVALKERISSILENTNAIQSEFNIMEAGLTDAQAKLTSRENEVQGNINTISRLGSENANLNHRIAQLQALAGNGQAYKNQAQQLANSNAEKDALIATLQDRPSNESIQNLRNTLNNEQIKKAELMRELQNLELKMRSMVDSKEVAKLADLQTQNEDLRRQLQTLQTNIDYTKLFVSSHIKLPLNAQALYNDLKGLEGYSDEKLRAAYTRIATEFNAENLQQVKFATGSSILNFTDQTTIKNKLDITGPNDYFLVVGYTSQTGNAELNETLSVNRATAVASIVNQLKKDGQDVRAVFLGQTNRFSKSVNADNQLCEIWRIKM